MMSLGWTTGPAVHDTDGYCPSHIAEMLATCQESKLMDVTFPVRACYTANSWDKLQLLVNSSIAYSLTVWTAKNDGSGNHDALKKLLPKDKTFF